VFHAGQHGIGAAEFFALNAAYPRFGNAAPGPGFLAGAFHPAAFFPLVSALAWACTLIMTRMMSGTERAITTMAYSSLVGLVMLSALVPSVWVTPSWNDIALGVFIGVASTAVAQVVERYAVRERASLSYPPPSTLEEVLAARRGDDNPADAFRPIVRDILRGMDPPGAGKGGAMGSPETQAEQRGCAGGTIGRPGKGQLAGKIVARLASGIADKDVGHARPFAARQPCCDEGIGGGKFAVGP